MMSSVSVPQESAHSDELFMQQGLLFSDTLKVSFALTLFAVQF